MVLSKDCLNASLNTWDLELICLRSEARSTPGWNRTKDTEDENIMKPRTQIETKTTSKRIGENTCMRRQRNPITKLEKRKKPERNPYVGEPWRFVEKLDWWSYWSSTTINTPTSRHISVAIESDLPFLK